jgi:hypothetical protein
MIDLTWQGDVAVVVMDDGENRWYGESTAALHTALGRSVWPRPHRDGQVLQQRIRPRLAGRQS